MTDLSSDEYARRQDAADPLPTLREEFHIPRHDGVEQAYFVGNSLGLQPGLQGVSPRDSMGRDAVEGHSANRTGWIPALVRMPCRGSARTAEWWR